MKKATLSLLLLSSVALAGFGSVPSPDGYSIYDKLQENVTNNSDGKSYNMSQDNSPKNSKKVFRFGSNKSYSAPISTQSPSPSPTPIPVTPPPVVTAPPSGGGGGGVVTPTAPPVVIKTWTTTTITTYKNGAQSVSGNAYTKGWTKSASGICGPCGACRTVNFASYNGWSTVCGVQTGTSATRVFYIGAGSY